MSTLRTICSRKTSPAYVVLFASQVSCFKSYIVDDFSPIKSYRREKKRPSEIKYIAMSNDAENEFGINARWLFKSAPFEMVWF